MYAKYSADATHGSYINVVYTKHHGRTRQLNLFMFASVFVRGQSSLPYYAVYMYTERDAAGWQARNVTNE